jgi:tetratricopeptide (TPR) repeat protein
VKSLARAIAAKLSLTLSGTDTARIDSIPTESIIAYNAYLRAIELRDRGGHNRETSLLVIESLEKSVETDPKFADAWVQLSIEQSRYAQSTIDDDQEKYAKAALASRAKAFTLNPELPEGIVADAVYQYRVLNEYQNALDLLTELELTYPLPARVVSLKSFLLKRLGNFESAYQTLKLAYELDPRSVTAASLLIEAALVVGRCQEANTFLLQALSMAPNSASVLTGAAVYEMACTGDINQAAQHIERGDYKEPWHFFTALRVAEIQSDYNRILDLSRIVGKFNLAQTSKILRVDALKGLGRHAEAEIVIEEIKHALFDETSNNAEVSLVTQRQLAFSKLQYFRLQQDQESVTNIVKEHKRLLNASTKGDKNMEQSMRIYYAEIFVDTGLIDQGVAELETYFASPGAYPFLYIDIYPMFASLKGNPRYEALREKYAKVD